MKESRGLMVLLRRGIIAADEEGGFGGAGAGGSEGVGVGVEATSAFIEVFSITFIALLHGFSGLRNETLEVRGLADKSQEDPLLKLLALLLSLPESSVNPFVGRSLSMPSILSSHLMEAISEAISFFISLLSDPLESPTEQELHLHIL